MASNNKTVVTSFSIVLFILLIVILVITYNSKCQMDNVEQFLGDPAEAANRDRDAINNINSIGKIAQKSNDFSVEKSIGSESDFFVDNVDASEPTGNSYNEILDENIENNTNENLLSEVQNNNDESIYTRDRLISDDLLPKDANSKWAKVNPAGAGDIQDQNFLTAGYHIGINTVGQSLRNANLQLRYEPPNPQIPVSPWGISTIEPDNRINGLLDIGSAPN
jgi:hypothetical protein|tara:strand:+ start:38 stop:703 length:666 start_codon:yes stop_codon:yes gene_type:complete